jgi:putative ATP-binding cassette transporter
LNQKAIQALSREDLCIMPIATPAIPPRTGMVRRFWFSARGFWSGKTRIAAWTLSICLLALVVGQLLIQYRLNLWNRAIFDALEKKDATTVLTQAAIFVPLAIGSITVAILVVYARMLLQRRWRLWMSDHLIDGWLAKGRYYQLNMIEGEHKNPEYRIAEDTRVATESPVDVVVGITSAVLTAFTFMGVLWFVGGHLKWGEGDGAIVIPGYLVISVVIYCIIISTMMMVIARAFIPAAEAKNQSEAELRYALTRLRENGESIAILQGEQEEREGLVRLLGNVVKAWARMAQQYMRTTGVSHGNFIIASVVPIILCAPKYLAGEMTLGQVMQAAAAFIQVQYAFNWLVDNYPRLAEWTASARRVSSLLFALDSLERLEGQSIKRFEKEGSALHLKDVSVMLSDGTVVVDDADAKIELGEKVLVAGESGTGKSTLVRAIAGLWPWGEGEITLQPGAKLFLMPQKPYIPIGTLRRAAAYPNSPEDFDDKRMREVMELAGLGHVVERLDETDVSWDRVLSGGEQQRLAFVRLFLHKPDIVVMDEATSALDTESQAMLMQRLAKQLPRAAIISVGHRIELEAFHERKLNLVRKEGGAQLLQGEISAPPVNVLTSFLGRWRGPRTRQTSPAAGSPYNPG